MSSVVAAMGVFALAVLAPFETTSPLVRLPWQSVSNVEAALFVAIACWGAALAWSGSFRRVWPPLALPLASGWAALIATMALASAAAPVDRANAWHMTGRVAAAAAVYALTVAGITTRRRLHLALGLCVASGVVVAILAALEYFQVGAVLHALLAFRPGVTAVGDQVRAGGPLQYPTIASMYLEVVFALGLGLMLHAVDASDRVALVLWFLALAVIGDAIAMTFTRAGLVTMAASLIVVGLLRVRALGLERGGVAIMAVACAVGLWLVSSRSVQSLWLRMTSEGQDAWYRAEIDAPRDLAFEVDGVQYVTVTIANSGRVTWDSDADQPFFLSYHWMDASGDRVVAYEGGRTRFDRPMTPGSRDTLHPLVRAPRVAGTYRLEWDVVQEDRLWFSTEQGAPEPTTSHAVVSGVSHGGPLPTSERPRRAVRPGRMVLWRAAARMVAAHPLLGVGPDNFRLLYGEYAGLRGADRRTHSNNMYLEVLVGGGVLAFAAFLWFVRGALSLFVTAPGASGLAPGNRWGQAPLQLGVAAAGIAIALHGLVDSFVSFAPTYILFALTLGFAAAMAGGVETADAHRV